jgi:glyoxalase superfamily protein
MSRPLPTRPNLEHLKKQAKDLLGDLQRQNPEAKLADALHAIAREYGFASWPKLKLVVEESLPPVRVDGSPFLGVWTADVSKSKRHPANQFQRATLQFTVDGDAVTITDVVVNAAGLEERGTNTIFVDGIERESADGHGYAIIARLRRPHVIETIAKKDGAIVGRGTYEVSDDGRTLIVSTRNARANADGWQSDFDQEIVLRREESQGDQEDRGDK